MSNKLKYALVGVLAAVVLGLATAWFVRSGEENAEAPETAVQRAGKVPSDAKADVKRKVRAAAKRPARPRKPKLSQSSSPFRAPSGAAVAADAAADENDESKLTAPQRKVMTELQKALDENDLAAVRKALDKYSLAEVKAGGSNGEVPAYMRARAVEALGWFGKDAAVDLISYLGDRDGDVAQDALNQFELALDDSEMSDRERSAIVMAAMKAINDPDIADSLLNQLNNMRNSLKAETIVGIMETGTEQAKRLLVEQLEMYTDSDVAGVDGVKNWAEQNPDDEGDEELYGGAKNETVGDAEEK